MFFCYPQKLSGIAPKIFLKLSLAGIFLFLFFIFNPSGVEAATRYANYSTGDDSGGANDCLTSGTPCKTFTRAYAASAADDTIDLTGTFDWSNADETGDTTSSYVGFNIAKNLTIQGQGADQTIIQANSSLTTATGKRILTIGGSYDVTIKNLTLRYGSYDAESETTGTAINFSGTGSLTILNSIFTQNANPNRFGGPPIGVSGNGKFVMRNSSVYDNNGLTSGGYYGYVGGLVLFNGATNSGNEVTNCTFYNNRGGYIGAIYLFGLSGTVKLTITNSTFVQNRGNSSAADVFSYNISNVYLKNNIFANSVSGNNVAVGSGGVVTDGGYNIVETQGSGVGFVNGVNGNLVGDQASLNVDTGLAVNSSTHGVPTLALLAGSVAIDAGDPNDGANNGINVPISDQRYFYRSGATDIGAFEYSGVDSFSRPDSQASSVNFSSVSYNQMTVGWTNGNGMRRAVFVKQGNSGTATPADNATYTANAAFGSGTQIDSSGWYCVYNGSGTSVTVTGLSLTTDYIVQVFEYSGIPGSELYFTDTATDNPNTQTTAAVSEPSTQANTIAFSSVAYTSMTVGWSNGNGEKRAVFAKQANTGTAIPVDGTTYTASTTFGSGTQIGTSGWYCVYNGTGASVSVSGLTAETDYIFQVFEYNGTAGIENYFLDSASNNPNTQAAATVAEPTTQAYNISFSTPNTTSLYLSWSNGNGSRRAVFVKQADSGTASPVDNTNYSANTTLGSGTQIGTSGWYCVYNSTGSGTWVYGLSADTNYIFQVFEYNYSGSIYNYFTDSASNNPRVQMTAATQPTTQASAVSFSSVATTAMTVSWTNGNGTNRAVFIKQASSGTATPVDNTTYTANAVFGSGTQISTSGWYCAYNGSGTSVDITDLTMGTSYSVQVFEYNGTAGRENYYTSTATNNPNNQATVGNYTLTYTAGAHGSVSGASPQTVSPSADGTAIEAVPDAHYHFVNWSDTSTDNPRTDTNVNANVSVTANFSIDTYSLAYTAGANGSISGTASQTIGYGSDGTAVEAVPDAHYHFVQWSDSSTDNPRTDTNITANLSVSASFAIDTYTLTYAAGTGGSISGSSSQSVNYGGNGMAVTAVPSSGYSFVKWSDDSIDNPRTDTNITDNLSVSASFKDSQDPVIFSVSADASSDSAIISWTTDEAADSQVDYGLTSALGSTENDAALETSHNINLSSLQSCATYYYQATSEDADSNAGVSEVKTFHTSGCDVSSISDGASGAVETSGGTVTLSTDDGEASLDAPNNYYSENLTIQINKLNISSAPSAPSGKNLIGDNFFEFLAVNGSGDAVSDFDNPIILTVSYGSDIESQYNENTLDVYKYSGGVWTAKSCTVDTAANTLTCALPSFSTYGIFGEEIAAASSDSEEIQKAKIESWKAYRYTTDSSCSDKLKLIIKGRHFADGAEVKIGDQKAFNADRKNSQKIIAKFCWDDLADIKTKLARKIYLTNPDAEEETADKKIHLNELAYEEEKEETDEADNPNNSQENNIALPAYSGDSHPNVCAYTVAGGDNLWTIAKKVYGDAEAYPLIMENNREKYPEIISGKLSIGDELAFGCAEKENISSQAADDNDNGENKAEENIPAEEPAAGKIFDFIKGLFSQNFPDATSFTLSMK